MAAWSSNTRVVSGSHAVQPPQTDNFIQLLFRDAGMQAKFGNSKVTVTLAIMLSPIFTWFKDDWASASCCHSAAVFSSGFGGITIFSTAYRSPVCFAHQTFAFNAQSLPGRLPGGIVNKMLSFSVGTVTLVPSAASHGLTGTTISRSGRQYQTADVAQCESPATGRHLDRRFRPASRPFRRMR